MSCIKNIISFRLIYIILLIILPVESVGMATFVETHDSIFHFSKHNIGLIKFKYLTINSFDTFIAFIILKFSGFHFYIPYSFALINVNQINSVLVLLIGVNLRISKLQTFIIIDYINLEHLCQFLYRLFSVDLVIGDVMEFL